MSYITKQNLIDELGEEKLLELADPTGAAENLDDPKVNARIQQAIDDAIGTFEAYARTRYTLPVPTTAKVKSTCLKIAVFNLFEGRATTDEGVYKPKENAYKNAIQFLKDVQKGQAALDVPASEETKANPTSSDTVLKGSSRSVFTDDKLSGY